MIWLAFFAAVVATAGNNIGKALQKRGVDELPPLAPKFEVLKAYFTHKIWLFGFVLDITGALLTAVALALAAVSVVQPILVAGVAFLAIFSHYYLHEKLARRDWVGVWLAVAGAMGMSTTLIKGEDGLLLPQAHYVWIGVLLLLFVCEVCFRKKLWVELMAGLQSGVCFGFSAAFMRGAMLLAQQHAMWLLGAVGFAGSGLISGAGFYFQTRGLQEGRAMIIGTYMAVFSLIAAVTIGFVALNEAFPPTLLGVVVRLVCMVVIVIGVAILAWRTDPAASRA